MDTKGKCATCGGETSKATAVKCQSCYSDRRRKIMAGNVRKCADCPKPLSKGNTGTHCYECRVKRGWRNPTAAEKVERVAKVKRVLTATQAMAPDRIELSTYDGDAAIISCLHIPFYSVSWVVRICESAQRLGVKTLIVAGDFLMADRLSKYDKVGQTVPIGQELLALHEVTAVLLEVFDRIILMYGNHDQRIERTIAKAAETKEGRTMLEMLAARMDTRFDPEGLDALAESYLQHFTSNPAVKVVSLPELVVNGRWLVMHAGASRVPPQHERAMAEKHRMSVIGGNSHLFGMGFDRSATDLAVTLGHACESERFRYIHEKPSAFPQQVRGCVFVLRGKGETSGPGRILPLVEHELWFSLDDVAWRLAREEEREDRRAGD